MIKIEIWSDMMCPFCYIGKRNYESALATFPGSDRVEVTWKSFQLDPGIPADLPQQQTVYDYLADRKGMSREQSEELHEQVTVTARQAGLEYNFDKAIVANSFRAHRVVQLAKTRGLGDLAEECFFRAYFTEGCNLGDESTLIGLGESIGLSAADVQLALTDEAFAENVRQDINEARQLGINAVPFFVFNRKYAVSGAQPAEVFLETLKKC